MFRVEMLMKVFKRWLYLRLLRLVCLWITSDFEQRLERIIK